VWSILLGRSAGAAEPPIRFDQVSSMFEPVSLPAEKVYDLVGLVVPI
jgi:hypothetical protein